MRRYHIRTTDIKDDRNVKNFLSSLGLDTMPTVVTRMGIPGYETKDYIVDLDDSDSTYAHLTFNVVAKVG